MESSAPESRPERRLLPLLAPWEPETQVWVAPDIRVDVLLRRWGVVVEYLGAGHDSPVTRARDTDRDRRLRVMGYVVLYVTAADLRDPVALLARVRAATASGGEPDVGA